MSLCINFCDFLEWSKEYEEDTLPSRMAPSGSNVKLSTSIFPNSTHLNAVTLS
ncbi:hypothetical protein VHA01S_085_00010 [Vibrio halioticoli NBRC 102217]|uniref:Uncharacterized protein n=1 Tax=Vibrio halioticoli NBRC 102217 TaxID=1219072 RepID=V5F6G4_9VIBR|nr:hypothetical protein VHA01S_085_00010 [Vibrio halioticoli NBRC 102217]